MNYHLHDKLHTEHRQELQNEMARCRLLPHTERRSSLGRRAIGKLGVALVVVGSKLEHFDQSRQSYSPVSSSVQR